MTNHETVKHLRDAQRRLRSVLVANADRLSTPFTDDPSKNPWDTYLRPAVRGLQEAVSAACDALAAAAAVSVPPPAPRADDQTALRDRIADALARLDAEKWGVEIPAKDHPFWQMYPTQADAVLAVLPEPADQAAVLNRAADEVFALDYDVMVGEEGDENLGSMREAWDLGTVHATLLLRRLAAEAPTTTKPEPDGEPYAGDERPCLACNHSMDSHIRVDGEIVCVFEDCSDPTPAEDQQDGAQP